MKKYFVILFVLIALFGCSSNDLPPEPDAPDSPVGEAIGVYDNYAPPYDVFDNNAQIFTVRAGTVQPGSSSMSVDVFVDHNGGYVYKYGWYYSINGWIQFEFPQSTVKGSNWISDSAELGFNVGLPDIDQEGPNYIIAYSCKKQDGEWKCGCSTSACGMWMLNNFSVEMEQPTLPDVKMFPDSEPDFDGNWYYGFIQPSIYLNGSDIYTLDIDQDEFNIRGSVGGDLIYNKLYYYNGVNWNYSVLDNTQIPVGEEGFISNEVSFEFLADYYDINKQVYVTVYSCSLDGSQYYCNWRLLPINLNYSIGDPDMPSTCNTDSDCGTPITESYCDDSGAACTTSRTPICISPGTSDSQCTIRSSGGCGSCPNGCEAGECLTSISYCYEPIEDTTYSVNFIGDILEFDEGWYGGQSTGGIMLSGTRNNISATDLFGSSSNYGCGGDIQVIWHYSLEDFNWYTYDPANPVLSGLELIETGKIYNIMVSNPCTLESPENMGFSAVAYCQDGCESGQCLLID